MMMNKIFLIAVAATVIMLGGCSSIPMKVKSEMTGMSGYAWYQEGFQPTLSYKCNLVEPESVCSNKTNFRIVRFIINRHPSFSHEGLTVVMMIPNSVNLKNGDIVKFSNLHVKQTYILNAHYDGIARTADKTDASCQFKGSFFGGETVCNGWTAKRLTGLY